MKGRSPVLSLSAVLALVGSLAGCLSGCGAREEPIPVEKSVFGDQVKQIDKAKDQAKQMENRMQDLNKKLGESGG